MSRALRVAFLVAVLAGCNRPGDNPTQTRKLAGRALSGTLAYPRSTLVSISAGQEAAQLVLSSPDSMKDVADWFLRALPLNGWNVKRTVSDGKGGVTIYAEQGQRPLWLTLHPNVGGPGTTYTMIGVIPADTAKSSGQATP
jgi:hypothetical protein